MATQFDSIINEHLKCLTTILNDITIQKKVESTIAAIVKCYKENHKILLCGNGGSAADAEHLAGELSGRFKLERDPLNAEALHVNGAALTAISNDYSFEDAYARILQAKAHRGDILIAISTSGTSKNVIKAIEQAKKMNLIVISICGNNTSEMELMSDIAISIPSVNTPRIQESYMVLGHIICEEVEKQIFQNQ
jgi:D-sedoheptulose 7-phosphate isomerase